VLNFLMVPLSSLRCVILLSFKWRGLLKQYGGNCQ